MYNRVKRIGTCLIVLILLLLFTVPSGYLRRFSDEAYRLIDAAEAAAGRDDAEGVRISVASLQQRTAEAARVLRLFISHDAVDDMALAIAVIDPAADRAALKESLIAARLDIAHLSGIEVFSWDTLL